MIGSKHSIYQEVLPTFDRNTDEQCKYTQVEWNPTMLIDYTNNLGRNQRRNK